MKVLGIDLAVTHTGVCFLTHTGRDWSDHCYTLSTVASGKTPEDLWPRLSYVRSEIAGVASQVDLVVLEAGSYASRTAHQHTLAGLWWLTYDRLYRQEHQILCVPPGVVKKYATGKGNAAKHQVALATAKMWPDIDTATEHEADALALASLGQHALGSPMPYSCGVFRQEIAETYAKGIE